MEELGGMPRGMVRFLYMAMRGRLARSNAAKPKRVHAKPDAASLNLPELDPGFPRPADRLTFYFNIIIYKINNLNNN